MFKIECLCDDRKLPEVLKTLDGLVYRLSANPVTEAEQMNGHIRPKGIRAKPDYTLYPKVKKSIQSRKKGSKMRFGDITEIAKTLGSKSKSHSALVDRLMRDKIVKRTNEVGVYERI